MNLLKKRIVCHYGEIGLKGKNRPFFEKKLQENIKRTLSSQGIGASVERFTGGILVTLEEAVSAGAGEEKIKGALSLVCGLHHFSFAIESAPEIKEMNKSALRFAGGKDFKTFKISAKRSDKDHPLKSMEINEAVGSFMVEETKKEVNLSSPNLTIFIEIIKDGKNKTRAFLFTEKIKGIGGLPVGSGGKALTLLSGGIDSPVASFLLNGRGVVSDFIHFHSYPFTGRESMERAKDAVIALNKYQFESIVYWAPFADVQKEIVAKAPASLRIVLYRRFMLRIASGVAEEKKIPALITGDSIGQVGSQTLENILAVNAPGILPIIRPLAGMDKEEIINIAKRIGSYEISIRACDDACSWFMPDNPATKATLKKIEAAEAAFDIEKMIAETIGKITEERIPEVRKDD